MGSALLKGWARPDTVVIAPNPISLPAQRFASLDEAGSIDPELVVFAVKPQMIDAVVPAYRRFANATFLSIAAGKTIARFEQLLGEVAIVRAMPNTPAAIGKGITVAVPNSYVTSAGRELVTTALHAAGWVEWMHDEHHLDAVTALSGSGPAYVFHLIEVLAKAGEQMGLPAGLAMRLARQTVIGSAHLMEQSNGTAAELREAVTSPGGTTAAALEVLMGGGRLQGLFTEALKAAQLRGKALAG